MQLTRRRFGKLVAGTVVLLATVRDAVSTPIQRLQRDERQFCIIAVPANSVANHVYGYAAVRMYQGDPQRIISDRKVADILGSRAIVEDGFVWYKMAVRTGHLYGEPKVMPAGPLAVRFHSLYTEIVAGEHSLIVKDKFRDRKPPSALFTRAYPIMMTDDFVSHVVS